jgi:aspartyl-tRNA(Asn)/glutamyl-tRNA(Gln) amidotransferase subunit B
MAEVLTSSLAVADYFEKAITFCPDTRIVANWVMGDVLRVQKDKNIGVFELRVTPKRLGSLLTMIIANQISASAAKKVFDLIEEQDKAPGVIVEEQGLKQISDIGALEQVVHDILARSPGEVARFKAGESKLMGYFVGEAMKATKGKGNPKEINRLVAALIQ